MDPVALVVLYGGICLLILVSSAVNAVIKAGGSLTGVLFQHSNSSSVVLVEHHSFYHILGINVVLL